MKKCDVVRATTCFDFYDKKKYLSIENGFKPLKSSNMSVDKRVSLESVAEDKNLSLEDLRLAVKQRLHQVSYLLPNSSFGYIHNEDGYSLVWLERFVVEQVDELVDLAKTESQSESMDLTTASKPRKMPKEGTPLWEQYQRREKLESAGYGSLADIQAKLRRDLGRVITSTQIKTCVGDLSQFDSRPHWLGRDGEFVYKMELVIEAFKQNYQPRVYDNSRSKKAA